MGPLFDIRGSVLAVGKRAQDTIYRNRETALAGSSAIPPIENSAFAAYIAAEAGLLGAAR
jgi:hypothetical protein